MFSSDYSSNLVKHMTIKQFLFIFFLSQTVAIPYDICDNFITKQNWNYLGNDLDPPTIQNTYTDCCAQCSKNEKCNAFTWKWDSNECYLKSSIGNGGQYDTNADVGHRQGTRK